MPVFHQCRFIANASFVSRSGYSIFKEQETSAFCCFSPYDHCSCEIKLGARQSTHMTFGRDLYTDALLCYSLQQLPAVSALIRAVEPHLTGHYPPNKQRKLPAKKISFFSV
ncbi:hypothetical protein FHG87_002944 [Trinorchestia longiramus]|nr:hypothetical protein FHG87_002944 [Trinorchestia longiramus]